MHCDAPARLSRRTLGKAGAAAAVAGLATGCENRKPAGSTAATTPPDKVTYLTALGVTGRESYVWVAQEKGFFREANIEVTIRPGAAGDKNHLALAAGQAQFAAVDSSGAFVRFARARTPGAPPGGDDSFNIVAAVQHTTLISILVRDGSGIRSPKDLEGKKIGSAAGGAPKTLFPGFCTLAGVDVTKVTWIDMESNSVVPAMATRQIDGAGLFVVAKGALEQAMHAPATALLYSTYLADLLGAVIVTPTKILKGNPDLVRRFTGAIMRGLHYAVDHPNEAGAILHRANPTVAADVAGDGVAAMRNYVLGDPGVKLGTLQQPRVARTIALLQSISLIASGTLQPDDIVRFDMLDRAPVVTAS